MRSSTCKDRYYSFLLAVSVARAMPLNIQGLQASSLGRSGGGARKGRRACNYVSGIWIPSPIPPWLPVDWAVRFLPISAKRKRTLKNTWNHVPRVMTSLLKSSPPISISHRLFRCRYWNSREVVASSPSPSFSRPRELTSRLAFWFLRRRKTIPDSVSVHT